jgi:hypothetical protein
MKQTTKWLSELEGILTKRNKCTKRCRQLLNYILKHIDKIDTPICIDFLYHFNNWNFEDNVAVILSGVVLGKIKGLYLSDDLVNSFEYSRISNRCDYLNKEGLPYSHYNKYWVNRLQFKTTYKIGINSDEDIVIVNDTDMFPNDYELLFDNTTTTKKKIKNNKEVHAYCHSVILMQLPNDVKEYPYYISKQKLIDFYFDKIDTPLISVNDVGDIKLHDTHDELSIESNYTLLEVVDNHLSRTIVNKVGIYTYSNIIKSISIWKKTEETFTDYILRVLHNKGITINMNELLKEDTLDIRAYNKSNILKLYNRYTQLPYNIPKQKLCETLLLP